MLQNFKILFQFLLTYYIKPVFIRACYHKEMTSKKVSDIRRMKISKTDRKDKKTHADQDKTSKNIKTEILECIIIW